jgi:hypothetical protein
MDPEELEKLLPIDAPRPMTEPLPAFTPGQHSLKANRLAPAMPPMQGSGSGAPSQPLSTPMTGSKTYTNPQPLTVGDHGPKGRAATLQPVGECDIRWDGHRPVLYLAK